MSTNQTEMPGMERPKIVDIEKAAEYYREVRDRRMKLTEDETAAKVHLMEVIKSHADELGKAEDGSISYRFDETLVTLKPGKENVKVKSIYAGEDGSDD